MNQKEFLDKIKELKHSFEEILHFISLGISSQKARRKGAEATNASYSAEKRKEAAKKGWIKRQSL